MFDSTEIHEEPQIESATPAGQVPMEKFRMSRRKRYLKALIKKSTLMRSIFRGVAYIPQRRFIYSLSKGHARKSQHGATSRIYIARRSNGTAGIFSHFICLLGHIRYSLELGCTPVVDLRTAYSHLYHEDGEQGKVNAWEKYFLQPAGVTLESVRESDDVIVNDDDWASNYIVSFNTLDSSQELAAYRRIAAEHLRFKPQIEQHLASAHAAMFSAGSKVLGVSYRNGYAIGRPFGHEIQPDLDILLDEVDRVLRSGGFTHVFLAVESQDVVKLFRNRFANRLITLDRPRISTQVRAASGPLSDAEIKYFARMTDIIESSRLRNSDSYMESAVFDRANNKFLKGLEYITEVALLSRCAGLVASRSGGVLAALMLRRDNYPVQKIFNLGSYGVDDTRYSDLFLGLLTGRER